MKTELNIEQGRITPRGISRYKDGINIAVKIPQGKDCGILLWIKKENSGEKRYKIPFQEQYRIGNISCMYVPGIEADNCKYQIYADEEIVKDVYGGKLSGTWKWGKSVTQKDIFYHVPEDNFAWEKDRILKTPFEDSCLYCLHVRGFTRHRSSNVEKRGTFQGIIEKIPYLEELGITAIEMMPAYEFKETVEMQENPLTMEEMAKQYARDLEKERENPKLNYWGYTKDCQYFAPKASYAANPSEAENEFKTMVKALHENGIELIMQFYFEKETPGFILEVLK